MAFTFSSTSEPGQAPQAPGGSPALQPRLAQRRRWTTPRIVFWCGLALFVAARVAQAVVPATIRLEPVEIDDAYRYLAQAKVMAECFGGDCPGLGAIQAQMVGGEPDPSTAFHRLRTEIHLFTYFHPVFSVILSGLRGLGLPAPQAYDLASIGLGIMLCIAIGVWIGAVWGPMPAGIALGLLAFYTLPGKELRFVPWALALGWVALSWAVILRARRDLYAYVPFLWIAALATHSMGLFYLAAALLMLLGMNGLRLDRRTQWLFAAGVVLMLARLALAVFVPVFRLSGDVEQFYALDSTWLQALSNGATEMADLVARWGATYWRLPAAAVLVAVGLAATRREARRRVAITALSLAAILLLSLLYYHPVHGNTASGRIWGSLAFFMVGAIGNAIAVGCEVSWHWIARFRMSRRRSRREVLRGAVLVLLGALLGRVLLTNIRYTVKAYPAAAARAIAKDNLDLGGGEALREVANAEGAVLYLDEVALYHSFAHGGFDHEAVYPAILSGEEQEHEWVTDNPRLTHAVGLSPLSLLPSMWRGAILVEDDLALQIVGPDDRILQWSALNAQNPGEESVLLIHSNETPASGSYEVRVPARFSGWLPLPAGLEGVSRFTLTTSPDTGPLLVRGLRLAGQEDLSWPWDQGVRLRTRDPAKPSRVVEVALETSDLGGELGLDLEVVSDEFSLVLARIRR